MQVLDDVSMAQLPGFSKRMQWFLENRADLARHIDYMTRGQGRFSEFRLLAVPSKKRLERILKVLLDENEFFSPYGIRSLSRFHDENPYTFQVGDEVHKVAYTPGESDSWMFGGNSNWRGPVWFPLNYLLIEALHRYHDFYGEDLRVECPTGSGNLLNLDEVAVEIARRLTRLFLPPLRRQLPVGPRMGGNCGETLSWGQCTLCQRPPLERSCSVPRIFPRR